jgi:phage tail sheath protein FI
MTAYLRPGVYVQETLNAVAPIVGANSDSVAAFIGANARGPISPTLVTSWSDYVNKFGSWNPSSISNALPIAVFLYFANGGSQAYVKRVTAGSPAVATRSFSDRTTGSAQPTLQITAGNYGTWGNASAGGLSIAIQDSPGATGYFDVTIYFGGVNNANKVESFTNLSMNPSDPRYAVYVLNAQSIYVSAFDLGSTSTGATRNPAVVAASAGGLSSGADGSTVAASDIAGAINSFDTITQSLILNAPGVTDSTSVNLITAYAAARNDVFVVIDPVNDTVANQISLAATYTPTSYAAVYYPPITINDPTNSTPGTVIQFANPGGAIVGKYAATDKSRGVFKAPAGLDTRIGGAVSVAPLTNANLDALNSASVPVNAIRFISGSGIVVMGARTLKAGYGDMYIPARRTLIYLEKALVDLTNFAIFEPNDTVLYRRITAIVTNFLNKFWAQGGLRGTMPQQAFFVLCDTTNNTLGSVEAGQVNIQVGVALQRPAEFVVINIGQFDGGATVTVA